jgi:proteasome lid subunit RPN8/RPN11
MARIPRNLIDDMIAHAREDLPNEACGQLNGWNGIAISGHPVKNIEASPYRYSMDPLSMLKLENAREDSGEALFAIYHSHVASEAYPSPTDVRQAFFPPGELDREPMYPDTYYILVSLAYDPPHVRVYHIRTGGQIEEESIEVVEPA